MDFSVVGEKSCAASTRTFSIEGPSQDSITRLFINLTKQMPWRNWVLMWITTGIVFAAKD
jgi:hypothetical protein